MVGEIRLQVEHVPLILLAKALLAEVALERVNREDGALEEVVEAGTVVLEGWDSADESMINGITMELEAVAEVAILEE